MKLSRNEKLLIECVRKTMNEETFLRMFMQAVSDETKRNIKEFGYDTANGQGVLKVAEEYLRKIMQD